MNTDSRFSRRGAKIAKKGWVRKIKTAKNISHEGTKITKENILFLIKNLCAPGGFAREGFFCFRTACSLFLAIFLGAMFSPFAHASPGVKEQLEKTGKARILLVLKDDDVRESARLMRKSMGVRIDTPEIVAQRARLYKQKKSLVLSRISGREHSLLRDYENFPVLYMKVNEHALERLLAMTEVASISEDHAVTSHLAQSLPLIGAPQPSASGSGLSVVVLDTGVDYTLSAFGSCVAPGFPVGTCKVSYAHDFTPTDDGQRDDTGHGTNVSGIVAGVVPDAKILGLDVFRTDGFAYYSDILDAMDWVATNKDVYNIVSVNMSFGGDQYTSPCPGDSVAVAIENLKSAGIVSVVSAGNDGYTDSLSAPACAPEAVSVGAVYDSDVGSKYWSICTDFSTAADMVACFSNSASFLTVLSPGSVISAAGITMSGTSQAAPHVSGAVAALKSDNGALTPDEVIARLTATGTPVTDSRNSITKPRLDLYAALALTDPIIAAHPQSFFFMAEEGGANPADQILNITNGGEGILNWAVGDNASWLTMSPESGTGSGAATLSVNITGLVVGTYNASITITAPGALNTPQTVPVTLEVTNPSYGEGFETGDLSSLPWMTGGAGAWGVQSTTIYSGLYAVKSPAMGNSSTSYLEVTLNICEQGYVYFRLKTSTEPTWDKLIFRIDGLNEGPWNGWSGNTDWTQAQSEHIVNPGLHTFRWEYSKDSSDSGGSDAVWLDDIVFPSFNLPVELASQYYTTVQAAYDAAAEGDTIRLQDYPFAENPALDRNISVTLRGGYDCEYTANASSTTIDGSLTISNGTVTVENIVIQ